MRHFHGTYKEVCDRHDPEYYPKFKKWCASAAPLHARFSALVMLSCVRMHLSGCRPARSPLCTGAHCARQRPTLLGGGWL
jgi:hypothetical protein